MRFAAALASVTLAAVLNRRQGIALWHTLAVAALCIPAAIWGARTLDMVEYGYGFSSAGSSIYGGFLLSVLLVLLYTWGLRIPPLKFLDAGAPAMALGEAVTRLGCFCAGCCYGVAWNGPLAVTFPRDSYAFLDQQARGLLPASANLSLPIHPVQLYGASLMLLVVALLLWLFLRRHRSGDVFFTFLISYGGYRLLIAPFRMEALNSMKAFSILFILVGIFGLAFGRVPSPKRVAGRPPVALP